MSERRKIVGDIAKHVSIARLWDRLMALAQFGALAKGGVNRQALCDEEIPARARLVRWGQEIGLEASTDEVANLFLRYPGTDPSLPPVMVGSHLDSQPTGGKFDGASGVFAALEASRRSSPGAAAAPPIELVAWMNEEGSRFAPGMMGSAVFCGHRDLDEIKSVNDRSGISVGEALAALGEAEPPFRAVRSAFEAAGFVEAHIEQGVTLQNRQV